MNHFTDRTGFNGIGSQPTWLFKAAQPLATHHPPGAYFTDYPPHEPNLAKKLFVPRSKLEYVFSFDPPTPLTPLPGGRGRLGRIFYSAHDYKVEPAYQRGVAPTGAL